MLGICYSLTSEIISKILLKVEGTLTSYELWWTGMRDSIMAQCCVEYLVSTNHLQCPVHERTRLNDTCKQVSSEQTVHVQRRIKYHGVIAILQPCRTARI